MDELSDLPPPAPRDAEYLPGVRGLQKGILCIAGVLLLFGTAVWLWPHERLAEMHKNAELVVGKIYYKSCIIVWNRPKAQIGHPGYSLCYRYTVSSKTFTGIVDVSYSYYSAAKVGDPITVYVMRSNPAYHSMRPTTADMVETDVVMPAAFGIALLLATVIFILVLEVSASKNLRRLRTWEGAVGTVIRSPGPGMIVVKYTCSDGEERTAIHWPRTRDISVDSEVVLLYNPRHRDKVVLFEELQHVHLAGEAVSSPLPDETFPGV